MKKFSVCRNKISNKKTPAKTPESLYALFQAAPAVFSKGNFVHRDLEGFTI
ncbi:hypothetical protein CHCC20441_3341 [Bacillus licheniformis]|uniref:Uncharacterized protein n=1 Tax=Bacillus licheniformis TaxID=1402 RepID=A0A8B5Y6W0_BACLI|nr:hypothetical protein B4092_1646 [Bacillus licheniformis]TWN17203.1 hypothetical protein CHCC14564_1768 [Bacillus licheniformis LMG 17339]KYC81849.1 hypothetical protein B4090_1616 [Bacillus licheniformis]KYC82516.1 hypothetical protein B4091_1360 [Bacillus licheniformis]KYC97437.1 hypothetical protein B4164_1532 [Bacillus licheniformis]